MKISDLEHIPGFQVLCRGNLYEERLTEVYCCDLLSFAMGRAPEHSAWITVMCNVNTLAVASLAEVGCVVISDRVKPDENFLNKADEQRITVLSTELPTFQAGLRIHEYLKREKA